MSSSCAMGASRRRRSGSTSTTSVGSSPAGEAGEQGARFRLRRHRAASRAQLLLHAAVERLFGSSADDKSRKRLLVLQREVAGIAVSQQADIAGNVRG